MTASYRMLADLPSGIPIFPLPGAILLPGAELPLNIFEPRYVAMVDATLAASRLIGMIQPGLGAGDDHETTLSRVGCAGRITTFQETEDGRYLIVLKGVARFEVAEETTRATPFRTVKPNWKTFAGDLDESADGSRLDVSALKETFRSYLERNALETDWSAIGEAPPAKLVNALSQMCPFTNLEKQALLEARTLQDRCDTLGVLLAMEQRGPTGGSVQ
jgi:Lon protease-like protein